MLATQTSGARVIAIRTSVGVDQLLDAVEDSVVAITVAGVVRYANPAAQDAWGPHLAAIARHADVMLTLRDARAGKVSLPQKLSLSLPVTNRSPLVVKATLTTGPLGTDFALVIARRR